MPEDLTTPIYDSYETPSMGLRELRDYTNFLSGKIKTIVDASIEDPQRRKAIKDLMHAAIWDDAYTPAMEWAQRQGQKDNETFDLFPFSHGRRLTPDDFEQR